MRYSWTCSSTTRATSTCIRSSRSTFASTSRRCSPSGATESRSSRPDTSLSRRTATKSQRPSGTSCPRRDEGSARRRDSPGGVMLALEVVPLPVTDIDRALVFYTEQAGFTLEVDYRPIAEFRVVQLTPPGSACSIHLVIADSPGRVHNLCLVTTDLADERAKLIARGVAVGAVRHKDPVETWAGGWSAGLDPKRRDYASLADFADPDGNTWTLQDRDYRG